MRVKEKLEGISVYRRKLLLYPWAVILPGGVYLLLGTLLESFGVFLIGFEATEYPLGWASRIVLILMLIVWLRSISSTFKALISQKPVMIVTEYGIDFHDHGRVKWDDISEVSTSFGYANFHTEGMLDGGVKILIGHLKSNQWTLAKEKIKAKVSKDIATKL